jgi:protein phosphatase
MEICVDNAIVRFSMPQTSNPQYSGMGTTLVVGVFQDGRLMLGHIGDSRCYRLAQQPAGTDHEGPLFAAGADGAA